MSASTLELAQLIDRIAPNSTVLDLRGYGLETLPEDIGTLTYLTKFNLNGNRLTSLPESIGKLTNLTELYLNGHKLTTLPESIGNLTNLTRLDLNGDRLESLPDSIVNLTKLTELNLNGNRFDRIPDVLFGLPNLNQINLDENLLTELSNLQNIPNLKIRRSHTISKFKIINQKGNTKIFIGDVYLDIVIADLSIFTNIVSLGLNTYRKNMLDDGASCQSLSSKAVEKILASISRLPNLRLLVWYIDLLPYFSILKSTSNLECIALTGTSMSRFRLCNFTPTSYIYIKDNKWAILSESYELTSLEFIYFNHCELTHRYWTKLSNWKIEWLLDENNRIIRSKIVEFLGLDLEKIIKIAIEDRYLIANFSNLGLEELPDTIGNISSLIKLDLSDNNLTSIPYNIDGLVSLEQLRIDNNRLKILPNSIGHLAHLRTLNLSNNQLISLPDRIGNLKKLYSISLGNNPLGDLSVFKKIGSLERLYFGRVNLPRRYWTKLSKWNPKWLLDEQNAEIRQTLINGIGYEKICEVLKAVKVDDWREYTLLKVNNFQQTRHRNRWGWIVREPLMLLKMTCPSTGNVHILRVPPDMTSAEDAIVWVNHGIHPDRFAVQT